MLCLSFKEPCPPHHHHHIPSSAYTISIYHHQHIPSSSSSSYTIIIPSICYIYISRSINPQIPTRRPLCVHLGCCSWPCKGHHHNYQKNGIIGIMVLFPNLRIAELVKFIYCSSSKKKLDIQLQAKRENCQCQWKRDDSRVCV